MTCVCYSFALRWYVARDIQIFAQVFLGSGSSRITEKLPHSCCLYRKWEHQFYGDWFLTWWPPTLVTPHFSPFFSPTPPHLFTPLTPRPPSLIQQTTVTTIILSSVTTSIAVIAIIEEKTLWPQWSSGTSLV